MKPSPPITKNGARRKLKVIVSKKTGQELDGASLMQKAFSPNPPILIALDDLSTESGKNDQQGHVQMFAGAMMGIRNAHANLNITKERALHYLFLSSLLFSKLDERPTPPPRVDGAWPLRPDATAVEPRLEKCQLESNRRYWDKWLANVEGDQQREPKHVRKFYEAASFRVESVGLAYLWPVTEL